MIISRVTRKSLLPGSSAPAQHTAAVRHGVRPVWRQRGVNRIIACSMSEAVPMDSPPFGKVSCLTLDLVVTKYPVRAL